MLLLLRGAAGGGAGEGVAAAAAAVAASDSGGGAGGARQDPGEGLRLKALGKAARKSAAALEPGLCVVSYGAGSRGADAGVPLDVVAEVLLADGDSREDARIRLVLSPAEADVLLQTRLLCEAASAGLAAARGKYQEQASVDTGRAGQRREDWTCPACEAYCFGSKSACFQCHEPRPADTAAEASPPGHLRLGGTSGVEARAAGSEGVAAAGGDPASGGFLAAAKRAPPGGAEEQHAAPGGTEKRQRGERGGRRVKGMKEKAEMMARDEGSGQEGCGGGGGAAFSRGGAGKNSFSGGGASAFRGAAAAGGTATASGGSSAARLSLLAGVRLKKA